MHNRGLTCEIGPHCMHFLSRMAASIVQVYVVCRPCSGVWCVGGWAHTGTPGRYKYGSLMPGVVGSGE